MVLHKKCWVMVITNFFAPHEQVLCCAGWHCMRALPQSLIGSTMAMLNGKTLAGLSAALRAIGHSSPKMHAAKAR